MKTYEKNFDGIRCWFFYDVHIKSWTVLKVDKQDNQIGNAEYYANKKSLLKDYKIKF